MDRNPALRRPIAAALERAFHVVELTDGSVPEWVELIPAGEFFGRDGRGPYALDAPAVLSAFADWGMPLPIDYEHQAFNAAENGKEAPAAGWVVALEVREDALWGRVEWTERAAAYISAREYRYLSPVFDHDKSGRVLRITGAGLTNNPNLYLTALNRRSEAPAASSHRSETHLMNELLERICHMLNLPLTSTPEEIKAHIQRLIDTIEGTPVAAMQRTLGLSAGKPVSEALPELLAAAHARLGTEPDPARYVPKAEFDRVAHSLSTLRAEVDSERAERTVQAAISAHKVSPGMADWARAYCKSDPAGFAAYVETAPVLMPGGGRETHAAQRVPGEADANPLLADAARRRAGA